MICSVVTLVVVNVAWNVIKETTSVRRTAIMVNVICNARDRIVISVVTLVVVTVAWNVITATTSVRRTAIMVNVICNARDRIVISVVTLVVVNVAWNVITATTSVRRTAIMVNVICNARDRIVISVVTLAVVNVAWNVITATTSVRRTAIMVNVICNARDRIVISIVTLVLVVNVAWNVITATNSVHRTAIMDRIVIKIAGNIARVSHQIAVALVTVMLRTHYQKVVKQNLYLQKAASMLSRELVKKGHEERLHDAFHSMNYLKERYIISRLSSIVNNQFSKQQHALHFFIIIISMHASRILGTGERLISCVVL